LSQPQSPAPWYPPTPPEKKGLSTGAIVAIIVGVVVAVIVVGALVAGAYFAGVQQSANLASPNMAITNMSSTYYDNCGVLGNHTTKWYFDATLVNTGGSGYAEVGYNVNGQQVTWNTYYVPSHSELPISDSVRVSDCYGSTTPTYTIVVLSERSA